MANLDDIPDDVPEEYLSGAALAYRSDEPAEAIDSLEKSEVMKLLRHRFNTPEEYVGETESNVSTKELRHIAKEAMSNGNGGED